MTAEHERAMLWAVDRKGTTVEGDDPSLVHIERINVRELANANDRFLRLLVPELAEETVLGRHVRDLLAVGRWRHICVVPEHNDGRSETFDLYGTPAEHGLLA
jgi:hypothetical protein